MLCLLAGLGIELSRMSGKKAAKEQLRRGFYGLMTYARSCWLVPVGSFLSGFISVFGLAGFLLFCSWHNFSVATSGAIKTYVTD